MVFWNTYLGKCLLTFFVSMVPVVELRGAIPFGVAKDLNVGVVAALAIAGNLLPVPFVVLFIRRIFSWLRSWSAGIDRLVTKLENRAAKKADTVLKYEFWGLVLLVAIPLPGTGAWTGSLVAAMLDLRLKKALPAIVLGVLIAATLMLLLSIGVTGFVG